MPTTEVLPTSFDYAGKTYTFEPLTLAQNAEIARWLKQRAIASAADPDTPPAVAEKMYSQAVVQIATGMYDPHGPGFLAALSCIPGQVAMIRIALRKRYPECDDEEFCRRMLLAEYAKIEAAQAAEAERAAQHAEGKPKSAHAPPTESTEDRS